MNFSKLKKAHRDRVMPELKEEDLEESFVRGMSFCSSSASIYIFLSLPGSGPVCYNTNFSCSNINTIPCTRVANRSTKLRTMCSFFTNLPVSV